MSYSCWALVGPTAVGKTRVAVEIARDCLVEIVGLDSRQIYKGMDIGTGKPTSEERAAVAHRMIDIIDPDESYNAMAYARAARGIIADIADRDIQPLIVGGTGFYLNALMGKISEDLPKSSPEIRRELQAELHQRGPVEMWQRLRELDERTAERLHPRDGSRIVRALEIIQTAGAPLSLLTADSPPRQWGTWRIIVLTMDRDKLKRNIRGRIEQMIQSGWVEEVERLLAAGYDEHSPGMSSLGYAEIVEVVRGRLPLEEARERISTRTWRYAKRQLTWFRRFPKDQWVTIEDNSTTTGVRILELFRGAKELAGR